MHHEVLADKLGYVAGTGTYPPAPDSGSAKGHVPVSLFLKGKKKKELILVVKHPGTKFDMSSFAKELSVAGGCRFASADQKLPMLRCLY